MGGKKKCHTKEIILPVSKHIQFYFLSMQIFAYLQNMLIWRAKKSSMRAISMSGCQAENTEQALKEAHATNYHVLGCPVKDHYPHI